jgi:hypothetical protein
VKSLHRYPVKSCLGEELQCAELVQDVHRPPFKKQWIFKDRMITINYTYIQNYIQYIHICLHVNALCIVESTGVGGDLNLCSLIHPVLLWQEGILGDRSYVAPWTSLDRRCHGHLHVGH